MVAIWFYANFAEHVKFYSLMRCGANCYGNAPAHVWQMGVATEIYNYFGVSVFARLCQPWFR